MVCWGDVLPDMHIKIAERLKPFSHVPGEPCVLPGSVFRCSIYPALIKIDSLKNIQPEFYAAISLDVAGPLKDFTVLQDLEKGQICVWGQTQRGFLRYKLMVCGIDSGVLLKLEKTPLDGVVIAAHKCQAGDALLIKGTEIVRGEATSPSFLTNNERLSLGYHKAQDWTLMKRRLILGEIFPLWFRLGNQIQVSPPSESYGTVTLLDQCRAKIENNDRLHILDSFQNLFLACFEGMLSPRLIDTDHWGFHLNEPKLACDTSPLVLLKEGSNLIRSLFVQARENELTLLPVLPVEFHCGRMTDINVKDVGALDLEWSKKLIRRMLLRSCRDQTLSLVFKDVKSFRLRKSPQDKGERINCDNPLALDKNIAYLFDNFQK